MGAAARNSSIQFATVDDAHGALDLADVVEIIESEGDHQPHVELVAIENTHMLSGGAPWEVEDWSDCRGPSVIARCISTALDSSTRSSRPAQSAQYAASATT